MTTTVSQPRHRRDAPTSGPTPTVRWHPALSLWLGSRVAVALAAFTGIWALQNGPHPGLSGFLAVWDRWDTQLFWKVARWGYNSPHYGDQTNVDFPGMPLALRLVHVVVRNWVAAGLIVSAVAMAVASVVLWRLAEEEVGPEGARRAVLFLVVAPYAVFFFAGYSEALFLAFSVSAWLAARQGRWAWAGVLAAGATGTRPNGIPFAIALGVYYLTRSRSGRLIDRSAPWLVVPALPVIGFVVYLHSQTGHWDAYTRAMRAGWDRGFASPLTGWRSTWHLAFGHQSSTLVWFWRAEVLAVVLGVVLTAVLLRSRRWAEATYVGLATVQMSATNYFASGVRVALVWFPLYLLLARVSAQRRWVLPAYLWVCAPVMFLFVAGFTTGQWVD